MLFEKFFLGLIIPFTFNEEKYLDLCADPDSNLMKYFTFEKKIAAKKMNEYGRVLLADDETAIVKHWRGKQNVRSLLGLHKNERCIYSIRRNRKEYCFHIEKIDVWFFKQGRAFLTVQISAENLNGNELLELKNLLVSRGTERKITYSVSRSKEEAETCQFTMKDLTGKFIQILESAVSSDAFAENARGSEPDQSRQAAFQVNKSDKIFFISFGLADGIDEDNAENFLELYRRGESGTRGITDKIEESFCFRPYEHIMWMVSENGLSAIGDYEKAKKNGENNVSFLDSFWNSSIINTYLPLYLYYLRISEDYEAAKLECKIQQMTGGINEGGKLPEMIRQLTEAEKELSSQPHINKLFVEYLDKNVLHISKKLKKLKKSYLLQAIESSRIDIFISYRRDGGFYLAQLLYIILKQSGKNPFLDKESLESGRYDEQILEKIKECQNVIVVLSPGSLDERKAGEDWMRKEIICAMENKKKIIPIMMDEFEYPENLSGVLKDFSMNQSVEISPKCFKEAVQTLFRYLK